MDVNLMDGSTDVRVRIIAAANELYARSGGGKFPSVAAVRHAAQADMNTTSAVMREWRRERQLPPTATTVPIPESVVHQANVALSTIWNGAVELAGEALRNAQANWDEERSQTEQHLQQVVEAFDSQTAELTATRDSLRDAVRRLEAAAEVEQTLQARVTKYEQQVDHCLTDRDRAVETAAKAREESAHLSGRLDALMVQNAELLARLGHAPTETGELHYGRGQCPPES